MNEYIKDTRKASDNSGFELEESIRKQLKITREKRHLTREEVSEGLIAAAELRHLEEGKSVDFWLLRLLMGRLHIAPSINVFYLNERDNALLNLEPEIRRSLLLWNYEEAMRQLKQFSGLLDKRNRFQRIIYYRLDTALQIRLRGAGRSAGAEEAERIRRFMRERMAGFEERLLLDRLFSPDELALIAAYYDFAVEDTAEKLKKLYSVVYYFRKNFAGEEKQYLFYADLMLACAQCRYALGEFRNCIQECEEGLKITGDFHTCEASGELYELMADARAGMFAGEELEAEEQKAAAGEILRAYRRADAIYDTFYFGYRDGHRQKLKEKAERWKIIMSE